MHCPRGFFIPIILDLRTYPDTMVSNMNDQLATLGWREWVSMPELGLPAIKAKIDTGARTSALHAFHVERYRQHGQDWVCFHIHPIQKDLETVVVGNALLKDERLVKDSGGHTEMRYVIETPLKVGEIALPIELTLTNRDNMRFRMLIGRQAMNNNFVVNPARSYLQGKKPSKHVYHNQQKPMSVSQEENL
uniref:Ribosomal protein S6 modification protein n=1 Tax=uncultured Thiotrichaceae bacterium TaxID=298394 RepID=A0A6S6TQX3_9GAMM|nr:MAG: Ribosomal protein S6 modification protein [uncultured Thiotrichaceae bacterium]